MIKVNRLINGIRDVCQTRIGACLTCARRDGAHDSMWAMCEAHALRDKTLKWRVRV